MKTRQLLRAASLALLPIGLVAIPASAESAPAAEPSSESAPPRHQEPRHHNDLKEIAHNHFEENAPDGGKDAVPHFAIFGKEGKFYLGIGGAVKATMGVDWGAPTDNPNEFVTSGIQPVAPGSGTKFNLSAMQSSLFVNFVALPDDPNRIGAFISMNFLNDYCPVLQYAYLKYRGIKVGYDYSVFSDNGCLPPTIDYEGPNASLAIPIPTLSYSYSFGRHKAWTASIGLDLSSCSITNNAYTHSVKQGAPDIPVAIKYAWGESKDNWVRASAILRNMNYHSDVAGKNVDKVGWGVSVSGTAEFLPNLRGFWTGVYGHGISTLIQDLYEGGLDCTPVGQSPFLATDKTWGAFGGLQYNFSPDVYCSAGYSHVRNYAKRWTGGDAAWGDQYKYAQYAHANLFWNITPIITTGIEYLYGRRVNNDGTQAHDNRLQCMLQVSF